jgi:alcohol dehydrogenase
MTSKGRTRAAAESISATGAVLERPGATRPYADSRPIKISKVTLDPPGRTEVLLRIEAAGVCHSDLSVVNGSRARPLPMLLGHEAAGIVETVGADVPTELLGRRVVTTFLPRCGNCAGCGTDGALPCENGTAANTAGTLLDETHQIRRNTESIHHHLGVSGFATHAVVDHRSVVPVGDDIPPEVAAVLGCAVLTGGGVLLNTAPPTPESRIAVVGLGGVGMAALLVARALGVKHLIAVDALPEKLERALILGADVALNPQDAQVKGIRADIVIEAAGHPAAFETAFELTAPGGTTVTVGLPAPGAESRIEPLRITAEARTIKGSYMGSAVAARDIPRYEQLWREGKLPVEDLVSSRIHLEDINEAMDRLADGVEIRQIVRFPEPSGMEQ